MVYGRTFGRIAVEAARRTGSFASGRSYIQRYFPPGYREPALKLVRAFEQAATGAGLYQIVTEFNNALQAPQQGYVPQANPQYKTRSGPARWSRSGYKDFRRTCKVRRKSRYSY